MNHLIIFPLIPPGKEIGMAIVLFFFPELHCASCKPFENEESPESMLLLCRLFAEISQKGGQYPAGMLTRECNHLIVTLADDCNAHSPKDKRVILENQ